MDGALKWLCPPENPRSYRGALVTLVGLFRNDFPKAQHSTTLGWWWGLWPQPQQIQLWQIQSQWRRPTHLHLQKKIKINKIKKEQKIFRSVSVCSEYLDIQIYLNIYWRIYSFAQIFVDFSKANIFGHSFETFFCSWIYSDIHREC